jgi:Tfp pilus assembly protein PilN
MKIAGLCLEGDHVDISIINSGFTRVKKIYEEKISLKGEDREPLLIERLSQWKNDYGIEGVVVGLDLKHFIYNFIELPVEADVDVRNALNYEMDKYLPLLPEEYYHDFHPIERNEPLIKYFVLSIRKERIEWILRCLDSAGMRLLGVKCTYIEAINEIAGKNGVANALIVCRDKEKYIGFDLEDSHHSMLVVKKEEDMTSKIEHLVRAGKELYLWEPGRDNNAYREVGFTCLEIPAHDLIAMSQSRKRVVEMNFLPGKHELSRQDKFSFAIAAMALISVIMLFLSLAISYQKDSAALQKTQIRLEEIKASAWGAAKTKKEIDRLIKKRNYLLTFQKERNKNIKLLTLLSEILPEDVWLSSISPIADEKVEIEGHGKRSAEIIGLLEKSAYFKNVQYSSPVRIKDGEERFSISMEMENEA